MQRITIAPRAHWQERVAEVGLTFHTGDDGQIYWDESAYYQFSVRQINQIEAATGNLMDRCLEAGQAILDFGLSDRLGLDARWLDLIRESWDADEPQLYGRFDFAYDGRNPPKLLEFNADTPTSLLEAAVAQWYWHEAVMPATDQFNCLHEQLVARWKEMAIRGKLHFTSVRGAAEDEMTTTYMRDTAMQAGLTTDYVAISDIGWNGEKFVDADQGPIENLFKLYPWEWLVTESYAQFLPQKPARLIEPIWKMLFSNKALLAILWHLYPGHANLLPAEFSPEKITGPYVRKPLLSREGANVQIVEGGVATEFTGGPYDGPCVYQAYTPLPDFDGNHPVIGSWVIGGIPAGMGIRESRTRITDNRSRFVPHIFRGGVIG